MASYTPLHDTNTCFVYIYMDVRGVHCCITPTSTKVPYYTGRMVQIILLGKLCVMRFAILSTISIIIIVVGYMLAGSECWRYSAIAMVLNNSEAADTHKMKWSCRVYLNSRLQHIANGDDGGVTQPNPPCPMTSVVRPGASGHYIRLAPNIEWNVLAIIIVNIFAARTGFLHNIRCNVLDNIIKTFPTNFNCLTEEIHRSIQKCCGA